jgi:hypothetical protein
MSLIIRKGWKNDKIPVRDIPNTPTEGFVLNKKVGGVRESRGWDARIEKIRVYDPRDFEFEISLPNLLFILRECNCSKGKGLEGKFVYAWSGTELILLPAECEDYKNSQNFTKLQTKTPKAKEMILGAAYLSKRQVLYTYMGKWDYFFAIVHKPEQSQNLKSGVCKKHVFWDNQNSYFIYQNDLKVVSKLVSDIPDSHYPEILRSLQEQVHMSPPKRLYLREQTKKEEKENYNKSFWKEDPQGVFSRFQKELRWSPGRSADSEYVHCTERVSIQENTVVTKSVNLAAAKDKNSNILERFKSWDYETNTYKYPEIISYVEDTGMKLFLEMENGKEINWEMEDFRKG